MPKYLIFNTVNYDGVGDFSHFEDIIKKLLGDSKFSDVEFIPIVYFALGGKDSNYEKIREKLEALKIRFLYGKSDDHDRFISNEAVQETIRDADQAIIISFDYIFERYYPYLKPGIPIKGIAEHENSLSVGMWGRDRWNRSIRAHLFDHDLGLGASREGIKIRDLVHQEPTAAWDTIQKNDPHVAAQLLACTNSPNFDSFCHDNLITPAYFNNSEDFISYLLFLSINDTLSQNIVVYLSGINLNLLSNEYIGAISRCFNITKIKQIEVYQPSNDSPMIIPGNPSAMRSMRILSGFFLSDRSFDAIYQLSKIAGVSGDNTLERCVSMEVLPFYWSTNSRMKAPTLFALQKITQLKELNISREAKDSFNIFFNQDEFLSCIGMVNAFCENNSRDQYEKEKAHNHYHELNLPKMIEAWPIISGYLRKNKNFYDKLENIVLEALPFKSMPAYFQKKIGGPSLNQELQLHCKKFNTLLKEIWNLEVLKDLLSLIIALAATLLTMGITIARTVYTNTFFNPESKEVTQDKQISHSSRFKQKLLADNTDKQEKDIMDEIKETINQQVPKI